MPLLRENAEAFPTLSAAELALVEAHGTRRSVAVGDYLFHQGDETSDFYVVVSGAVDIVLHTDGIDQVIVQHGPGSFAGELNLVTGLRLLLSALVVEPGEIVVVSRRGLQYLLATEPGLSDTWACLGLTDRCRDSQARDGFLRDGDPVRMDPFIEAEKAQGHSVARCCVLFQVSRAAYYQRCRAVPSARALADRVLTATIRSIHAESAGTYGSPRVQQQLRKRGTRCGRRRVARLMRQVGLEGCH